MKMMYRTSDQRRMLDAALEKTRRLRAAADRLIATAFEANFEAAAAAITFGLEEQEAEAKKILEGRRPFHWPVEFPEVFLHNGGFDAIVGNPPFIGGQRITGALGTSYRDYLVKFVAGGKRGSADYVAYFFLRAFRLLKDGGTAGLLATNTVAQGDTREVGLDQVVFEGANIYRAIPSRKWPGEASLEVAHIWLRKGEWNGTCLIENSPVKAITTQLDVPGNVIGKPFRLAANAKKSFQGSIVLGMGYVLNPDLAQQLLEKNPRNREVLFPYLKGEDLTERWDQSPSRWVINFRDWPIERAMEYPDCFEIVEREVMPERTRRRENCDYQLRYPLYERWWHYGEKRPALYSAIEGLDRVLVAVRVSTHHCISLVPSRLVYSDRLAVFAFESSAEFALLTSTLHDGWAHRPGATTHETRNTYFPEQSFETFPFPVSVSPLESVGERYNSNRAAVMASRREGLTSLYNRFHSPQDLSQDISNLRKLHVELDYAVATAYGWASLDLGHGFHETKQGIRFTISESARREVLDRLLALNHERYAKEQADPLSAPKRKSKSRRRAPQQTGLF